MITTLCALDLHEASLVCDEGIAASLRLETATTKGVIAQPLTAASAFTNISSS